MTDLKTKSGGKMNKIKKFGLLSVLALVAVLVLSIALTGCGQTTETVTKTATTTVTQTPGTQPTVTTTTTTTATPELSGTITESGSTTVQPLAEKFANAFMADNTKVSIVIQGGGSSVGVKSANDGTVDIGAISRELNADEPQLVTHLLAKDGIALVVHPTNSVSNLTKEQIQQIYNGTITNWSEVGGANKDIHVVAREEGSGTRVAFEEMVMGKDNPIVATAILQSSNGALMQVVKNDPDAIGFLSFGYLDNTVKALSVNGIAATTENANPVYIPSCVPCSS
jgi:phosphate transport system substrate-binding protein